MCMCMCTRSQSQWTEHIAFANDTCDTSRPDMRARICVPRDTWGRARDRAYEEGRARKPSSNSRTGDLERWTYRSNPIIPPTINSSLHSRIQIHMWNFCYYVPNAIFSRFWKSKWRIERNVDTSLFMVALECTICEISSLLSSIIQIIYDIANSFLFFLDPEMLKIVTKL